MPKSATSLLIWSEDRGTYEVRHQDGRSPHPLRAEDQRDFIRFIDSASFAFQGKHGRLTLRKESRPHGAGYWYAYRSQGRRTLKKYAGRTADLTIARLEDIAEALTAEACSSTDECPQVKEGGIPSLERLSPAEAVSAMRKAHVPSPVPTSPAGQFAPLFAPKLHLPRLHAALVARERLLSRLDAGLEGKLTLLSAPAGCGKTTLVSQWVADRRSHQSGQRHFPIVAWVSLDPEDNDPIRFWSYIMTACQAFQQGIGQSAPALLHTVPRSAFEPSPPEAALRTFLNEAAALARQGMLVLEDYQVITSPQIHELVTFLLDHLPATLHLVMISRLDPPLPLARLRASGDLNELHAADLRFSQEETQAFLRQVEPFPLSPGVMMHLDTLIEGWVTGLRLVALTLQGQRTQQEIEHFLATFSGSHRHVVEFFITEVLDAQPEALQTFLLHTSMLSRLTASLCDAVTGGTESEQLLETVVRAQLFLQPLDGSEQWYRYHPLFAEALQREARLRLGEEMVLACFDRASRWYEQRGMLSEAVEAALESQAFTRTAVLMDQLIGAKHLHEMQEHYTLRRWLDALPEAILGQHPELCLRFAMLLLYSPDRRGVASLARIERLLQMAERVFQAENNHGGLGEAYAFRTLLAGEQGDLARAGRLARQALAWLPESEQQWRGTCLAFVGEEALLEGKLNVARQTLLEAQALYETAGNSYATRAGLLSLGEVCLLHGELRQAAALYREVLTTVGEDLSDKGKALLGLARLSYEWNDLEAAEQQAHEASDLGTRLADETLEVHASLVLVGIEHARGQTAHAQHLFHMLLARMQRHTSPLLHREMLVWQARLSLAVGDRTAVERWSNARALYQESVPQLQQEQEDFMLARLRITKGEADEALRLLERWRLEAHQQGRTRSEVEALLLIALAHVAQRGHAQASSLLREALLLTHADGYQRLFLDEGEEIAALLRAVLSTGREGLPAPYARTLLRAFAQQQLERIAFPAAGLPVAVRLIEPLSAQEQRVLRLLVAGFSNPEIAEVLVVSGNTVKTHVRSIYQKLNVKSRKEAREAVRSENLL